MLSSGMRGFMFHEHSNNNLIIMRFIRILYAIPMVQITLNAYKYTYKTKHIGLWV